jgi:hypothetical protein
MAQAVEQIEEQARQEHIKDCQETIARSMNHVYLVYRDRKGVDTARTVIVKWTGEKAFGGLCELRGGDRVFLYDSVIRMESANGH